MRQACACIKKPMMANMADGGKTPIRSQTELAAIGYRLAIFPQRPDWPPRMLRKWRFRF